MGGKNLMSRDGFTCQELSLALGVRVTNVSQAVDSMETKAAKLWRIDPDRAIAMIRARVATLPPMTDGEMELYLRLQTERVLPPPMSEHELGQRILMQTGRLNRPNLASIR